MTLKRVSIIFIIFFIIGGVFVYAQNYLFSQNGVKVVDVPTVLINDASFKVELADTPQARVKGLSGRESLPAGTGMLFVFPEKAKHRFWMPDMNFPIDIIWITDGQVVGVEHEVSPVFNPDEPVFYLPPVPVEYVLEVNSGVAKEAQIKIGDKVKFSHI